VQLGAPRWHTWLHLCRVLGAGVAAPCVRQALCLLRTLGTLVLGPASMVAPVACSYCITQTAVAELAAGKVCFGLGWPSLYC
jgi:hypothetical protein